MRREMHRRVVALVAALVWVTASGCNCTESLDRRKAKLVVLDAEGNRRENVDFGNVQVNTTVTRALRLRSDGTGRLELTELAFDNAHFSHTAELPVHLDPAEEFELPLTFTPTEPDRREDGIITLKSNDDEAPSIQVRALGTGILAAAVPQPEFLDFGEVYVGESKSLTFTLTNAGSDALTVTSARLENAEALTTDLPALQRSLQAGASVEVQVVYAPTQQGQLAATLELALAPPLDRISMVINGRAVQAVPKLCFRFDDSGLESCSDGLAGGLNVDFGALCDARVFPPDAGLGCAFDGGAVPYERSGSLYVRNEGNYPVSFSFNVLRGYENRCDGGSTIDFSFSNAPDGGPPSYMVPTATLAGADMSPPVAVRYLARSHCRGGDDADVAFVSWTRQQEPFGTMRQPSSMVASMTGTSLLPDPEPFPSNHTINSVGTFPFSFEVPLVSNVGRAPLQLLDAGLRYASDGGSRPDATCAGVDAGPCAHFHWLDGPHLPVTLEGSSTGAPVSQVVGHLGLGKLVSGLEDGGSEWVAPTGSNRVWVEVQTSDPYEPVVLVPINATVN